MPDRYHRVVYRSLPEGQEWAVVEIDGEQVIVISEALDEEARKRARKAARASILGRGALLPLPVIAGAEWLRDRLQSPMSAAIVASTVTMTGAYALTELTTDDPPPVAHPPVIVTLTAEATPAPTASHEPAPTRTRPPSRSGRPTARRDPAARPTPEGPRPTQAAPTRTTRPTRTPEPREAPEDRPTRTEQEPAAAVTRTSEPPVSSGREPTREPARPPTTPPPVADDPPPADTPPASDPPALTGRDCRGIHVGVPLDPLLNLDLCLLD